MPASTSASTSAVTSAVTLRAGGPSARRSPSSRRRARGSSAGTPVRRQRQHAAQALVGGCTATRPANGSTQPTWSPASGRERRATPGRPTATAAPRRGRPGRTGPPPTPVSPAGPAPRRRRTGTGRRSTSSSTGPRARTSTSVWRAVPTVVCPSRPAHPPPGPDPGRPGPCCAVVTGTGALDAGGVHRGGFRPAEGDRLSTRRRARRPARRGRSRPACGRRCRGGSRPSSG